MLAFQDFYPENVAHCYGCGRLNAAGHQIKTHWDGDESVTRYTPRPEHTAVPGFVYGGLIASLIVATQWAILVAAAYLAKTQWLPEMPTAHTLALAAPAAALFLWLTMSALKLRGE